MVIMFWGSYQSMTLTLKLSEKVLQECHTFRWDWRTCNLVNFAALVETENQILDYGRSSQRFSWLEYRTPAVATALN